MSSGGYNEKDCSVYIGNLDSRVTEEILWELFLQAGPLENVRIPKDKETGKQRSFGFIEFTSPVSVHYASQLMGGMQLYGRAIIVKPQQNATGSPVQTSPSRLPSQPLSPDSIQVRPWSVSPYAVGEHQFQRSSSSPGSLHMQLESPQSRTGILGDRPPPYNVPSPLYHQAVNQHTPNWSWNQQTNGRSRRKNSYNR